MYVHEIQRRKISCGTQELVGSWRGKDGNGSWFEILNPSQNYKTLLHHILFPNTDYVNEHICSSVNVNANWQLSTDVGLYETCEVWEQKWP